MKEISKSVKTKLLIKKCHLCGQVVETITEQARCAGCGKSFLPLNYFAKIHEHKEGKFSELFAECHELNEEDLVKGLYVIW